MGGSAGEEPVAMTKRRALTSMASPTTTVSRSLNRAAPSITRTPSPVKRSFESFGAIASITACTRSWTLPKSTSAVFAEMPKPPERAMARAWLAAAISAFDGTQPVLRHSPPSLPFSMSTTETPKAAAAAATDRPPEPAPITQMSGVKQSAISCLDSTTAASPGARRSSQRTGDACARLQPLHDHRNQRENAERRERGQKLRRDRAVHVELEPAIGASRRQAGLIGGLLGLDHAVETRAQESEDEGGGNDPERGSGSEGRERHPEHRRNQIDEPERKDRHQPQEQKVVEGVRAEAVGELLRQRTGTAHEMLPQRAPRDEKDANRSDRGAHQRRRTSVDRAEQNSADHGEIESDRHRQRGRRDIERNVGRYRRDFVCGDELLESVVVSDEHLERDLAVPAQGHGGDRDDRDREQRDEAPRRQLTAGGARARRGRVFLGNHDGAILADHRLEKGWFHRLLTPAHAVVASRATSH